MHPDIRRQLADYWAIDTVLGISDFHSNNWLIRDGRVMPIDLAELSKEFLSGSDSIMITGQQPFGRAAVRDLKFFRELAQYTSPRLRLFFNYARISPSDHPGDRPNKPIRDYS